MTTRTWTGAAGDNLWNTAGNWSGNAVPTISDDVVISGSQSIDFGENNNPCRTFDGSAFTGALTSFDGVLRVAGPTASFGAGCDLSGLQGFRIVGDVTVTAGAGANLGPLWVQTGSLTLGSNIEVLDVEFNNGITINLGAYSLTTAILYLVGASSWTWSAGGKVVVVANGVNPALQSNPTQASPSLPPLETDSSSATVELTGGDLTVDHLTATGPITLNGFQIIEINPDSGGGGGSPAAPAPRNPLGLGLGLGLRGLR